jgi:hypothetical protein
LLAGAFNIWLLLAWRIKSWTGCGAVPYVHSVVAR